MPAETIVKLREGVSVVRRGRTDAAGGARKGRVLVENIGDARPYREHLGRRPRKTQVEIVSRVQLGLLGRAYVRVGQLRLRVTCIQLDRVNVAPRRGKIYVPPRRRPDSAQQVLPLRQRIDRNARVAIANDTIESSAVVGT